MGTEDEIFVLPPQFTHPLRRCASWSADTLRRFNGRTRRSLLSHFGFRCETQKCIRYGHPCHLSPPDGSLHGIFDTYSLYHRFLSIILCSGWFVKRFMKDARISLPKLGRQRLVLSVYDRLQALSFRSALKNSALTVRGFVQWHGFASKRCARRRPARLRKR